MIQQLQNWLRLARVVKPSRFMDHSIWLHVRIHYAYSSMLLTRCTLATLQSVTGLSASLENESGTLCLLLFVT